MKLTEERKKELANLLENIPEEQWDKVMDVIKQHVPKKLEIFTYLQKFYEDDDFCLIATYKDETTKELDFIEFTDKREKPFKIDIWDNDKWWSGILENNSEFTIFLDLDLLPIVQQFLKQILNKTHNDNRYDAASSPG